MLPNIKARPTDKKVYIGQSRVMFKAMREGHFIPWEIFNMVSGMYGIFFASEIFLFNLYSERRECYYESDIGNSYNGRANVTASGRGCLPWAGSTEPFYKNTRKAYHEFESNYCRAYEYYSYKSREPLCLVEYPSVKERCGVLKCGEYF